MSKKAKRLREHTEASNKQRKYRRKGAMIVIGLMLCLSLAGMILARRETSLIKMQPALLPLEPRPSPQTTRALAKEYIYASDKLVATEEPIPPNAAQFVSQAGVPQVMIMSRPNRVQTYPLSVTMKNVGTNTWIAAAPHPYQLKSLTSAWSPQTVDLQHGPVVPNSQTVFSFNVTVPQRPSRYNFQWKMTQQGLDWFDDSSQNISVLVRPENPFDFDGDGKVDIVVWRSAEGNWYVLNSSNGQVVLQQLGYQTDKLVPGDYDGDLRTDIAVWRPNTGVCSSNNCGWEIKQSSTGTVFYQADWGAAGDIPVPADYDGDGKTDKAVWRPAEGNWYIIQSSNGTTRVQGWGNNGDKPVPGDYDGDGKADLAIFRPAEGNWYIIQSSNNTITLQNWGQNGDITVPSDYDGDGKIDCAVWRPADGTWYIHNSADGTNRVRGWGGSTDRLVPADYDGDGKTDIAIWRPSEGNWYIIKSSDDSSYIRNWGAAGDIPVSTVYVK